MRATVLLLLVLVLSKPLFSANYYFSSSSGNDSYSTTQARNPSTPWRSIAKLNSIFSSLQPGDSVLFKRGETFYGSIVISRPGTSLAPIVLGGYGSGAKPVITGFTQLSGWVSKGGGIYESSTVLPNKTINAVTLNNTIQQMGRFPNATAPNKGFLFYESHSGKTSITDNELTSSPNWKGAEMVVRVWKSAIDRVAITAHNGRTLSGNFSFEPNNGHGYFIQNHIGTLDQQGEWYFNPSTKKLSMFFANSSPSSLAVRASTLDNLVFASDKNHIIFSELSLQGANQNAIQLRYGNNITIKGCEFLFSGTTALAISGTNRLQVLNNTFNHSLTDAISTNIGGNHWVIRGNTIKNTAVYEGLCQKGNLTGYAIYPRGSNHTIEGNTIDSTGFCAIRLVGNDILIKNNVITYFNLIKNDGSAIYGRSAFGAINYNRRIIGNIIRYGIGGDEGVGRSGRGSSTSGIYFDNNITGVEITGNTVTNCSKSALYIHNSFGIKVHGNTFFDNWAQIEMVHDKIAINTPLRKLKVSQNIFFSKTASQTPSIIGSIKNDIRQIGEVDENYYCHPLNNEMAVKRVSYVNHSGQRISTSYALQNWQSTHPFDRNSKRTPRKVPTYTINSLSSTNKFGNGKFDRDISSMFVTTGGSWVSSKLDGGTFQGTVPSSLSGNYQVIPSVGAVSSSKSYIVRFSAQSTKDTVFSVYLRQSGSPFTVLSEMITFNVGTTRQEYEFLIHQPQSQSSAGLVFVTRGANFRFWLDNISLQEANVTLLNLDKQIRFECNPTGTSRTIALDAVYVDVKNKRYTGNITLQPYTSIILLRESIASTKNDSLVFLKSTYDLTTQQSKQIQFEEQVLSSDKRTATVILKASDANGDTPNWLTINGKLLNNFTYKTGSKLPIAIGPRRLKAGRYTASLTASADDYKDALVTISLTVTDGTNSGPTTLKVNFQDENTTPPAGWVADFGQAYGPRTAGNQGSGFTYGWLKRSDRTPLNLISNGRNRQRSSETLRETLMHIQAKGETEGIWEAKVANGTYDVTVMSGDNSYLDSRHSISIEGIPAITNFAPTSSTRFKTATVKVQVQDGRLTVIAAGGNNTKINYIIIEPSTQQLKTSTVSSVHAAVAEESFSPTVVSAPEKEGIVVALQINNVYPNPSTGHFNVSVQSNTNQLINLAIADLSGRIVEQRSGITPNSIIPVGQNLPKGTYFIRATQDGSSASAKIIKL